MLYRDYLSSSAACPFCDRPDRVLAESGDCYLTYAIAPYHPHHLLVVPKRHTLSFLDFTGDERAGLAALIERGAGVLKRRGYDNFTVLVREGHNAAKSVPHVHFHIVPEKPIGDLDHTGGPRVVLSEEEIGAVKAEVRALLAG